jgi:hypothetical protein
LTSGRIRCRFAYGDPAHAAVGAVRPTFRTAFGSLRLMRDWLIEAGLQIVAMESRPMRREGNSEIIEISHAQQS